MDKEEKFYFHVVTSYTTYDGKSGTMNFLGISDSAMYIYTYHKLINEWRSHTVEQLKLNNLNASIDNVIITNWIEIDPN